MVDVSRTTDESQAIDALLQEGRVFEPPAWFKENGNCTDARVYEEAQKDPETFWANEAKKLKWFQPWDKVLDWNPPDAKWFINGKLNVTVNCLDRHVEAGFGNKGALLWEGEPGDSSKWTYQQLLDEVCKVANGLKSIGVKKGDRVAIYLPMIPELTISLLACARIGAVHSVVFGGFSKDALRDRIEDAEAKIVITSDGGYRRGKELPLKPVVDAAVDGLSCVEHVVVVKRTGGETSWMDRDVNYSDLVSNQDTHCDPEWMDSEDLLFILYTSGTTGKPKGIMHTTGGYLTGVTTTAKYVFDLKDNDVYWCTADIGWITGHSYIVYGPLSNRATVLMYEGTPDTPAKNRFWEIVEKYGVTILYTAPTAIRMLMKWGVEWTQKNDLSSLRLLGTVGEPINPEAWMWYRKNIGHERCPIVDTWWQTETGMILITSIPGITATRPGSATFPFPGVSAKVVDEKGQPVPEGKGGYLILDRPYPGMLRGLYKDPERFQQTYWSKYKNIYFTGDGARRDKDGYFWVLGRVDDVLNVSGHRIGTMEVESALVEHPIVCEAAVVGKHHEIKGQALSAFVTLEGGINKGSEDLQKELKQHVAKVIGPIARPDDIIFTADLPKTRSGKIMRRLLRDIAEGRALGDTTTLADPKVVEQLKTKYTDE